MWDHNCLETTVGPVQEGQLSTGVVLGSSKTKIWSSVELPPVKMIEMQGTFPVADYSSWISKNILVYGISLGSGLDFSVQLNGDETNAILDRIAEYIELVPEVNQRTPFVKTVGSPCLAMFPDDGLWYRARIVQDLGTDVYEVNFVDYGDVARIKADDMMICPPDLCNFVEGITQAAILGFTGDESPEEIKALRELVVQKDLIARIESQGFEIKGKTRMLLSLYSIDMEPIKTLMQRILAGPPAAEVVEAHAMEEQLLGVAGSEDLSNVVKQRNIKLPEPTVRVPVSPVAATMPVTGQIITGAESKGVKSEVASHAMVPGTATIEQSELASSPLAAKATIINNISHQEPNRSLKSFEEALASRLEVDQHVEPELDEPTVIIGSPAEYLKRVIASAPPTSIAAPTGESRSPGVQLRVNVQAMCNAERTRTLPEPIRIPCPSTIRLNEDSVDGFLIQSPEISVKKVMPTILPQLNKSDEQDSRYFEMEMMLKSLQEEKESWNLEKLKLTSRYNDIIENQKCRETKEMVQNAQRINLLNSEKTALESALEQSENHQRALHAEVSTLKEALIQEKADQNNIDALVKSCESRKEQEVTDKLSALHNAALVEKNNIILQLSTTVNQLQSELNAKNGMIQEMENHNRALNQSIQELNNRLTAKQAEVKAALDLVQKAENEWKNKIHEKEQSLRNDYEFEMNLLVVKNEDLNKKLEATMNQQKKDLEKQLQVQKVTVEQHLREEMQRQLQFDDGRQTPLLCFPSPKGDKASFASHFEAVEEPETDENLMLTLSSTLTACLKSHQKCQQKYKVMITERDQEIARLKALIPFKAD